MSTWPVDRTGDSDEKHQCDNCQKIWTTDQLQDIADIYERIEPGGTVPSGECPKCGCLCYPLEEGKPQPRPRRR
ncbi:MAG: hypothetical protein L0312_20165 [Acidobacteria bacterium]|nr:hypothetical protein [Acidobacteriota bacterium]